jgi:murein DD-endopeptidase MepM/ murein hydrolase activator NlpD
MQSPVKKEYITQVFGANPQAYAQFGLKGHNGIDYRAFLPNGDRCYEGGKSEVFAPHDGKVIEKAYDAGGYGNYVKIENDGEGSVLAHFSSPAVINVGDSVKAGQFIAYQGTTGNSTGIHLHWGYYKKPRDRSNGYNGYINQAGMYEPYKPIQGGSMSTVTVDSAKFEELVKKSSIYDEFAKIGFDDITDIKTLQLTNERLEREKSELQGQLDDCQNPVIVPVDPNTEWKLNGKTETWVENGKTVTLNYAIKQ